MTAPGQALATRHALTASLGDTLLAALDEHPVFRRHSERVGQLTLKICAARQIAVDERAIGWAARFHDLTVLRPFRHAAWGRTYVDESADLARTWLAERTDLDAAAIECVVDCIRHHHDLRRHADPVVDAFRRADWSEVSGGILTAGLPRQEIRALHALHPARGFQRALAGLLVRFTVRPINYVRIFWPHRIPKGGAR